MSAMAKPWYAHYQAGVRPVIDTAPYATLAQFASDRARTFGAATAFTCMLPNGMAGSLSFTEVDRLSDAFAVYLREVAGLKIGDRVAIQIPNGLSYPIVAFGAFKAGCVLVNVNPLYTADEMAIASMIQHPMCWSSLICLLTSLAQLWPKVRSRTLLSPASRNSFPLCVKPLSALCKNM